MNLQVLWMIGCRKMKRMNDRELVNLFGRIRDKMSFRQFCAFMQEYSQRCYVLGLREGEDEGITFDEDQLRDLLIDEGVGLDIVNRVIERIFRSGQEGLPVEARKVIE